MLVDIPLGEWRIFSWGIFECFNGPKKVRWCLFSAETRLYNRGEKRGHMNDGGGFSSCEGPPYVFWYILIYFLVSERVCKIDGTLEG